MLDSWAFAVVVVVSIVVTVVTIVRSTNNALDRRDARRRNQAHPWRTRDGVRRRR